MAGPLTNSKHEKFTLAVFEGDPGRKAYRDHCNPNVSDAVADSAASRLLKSVKVAARLDELKASVAEKVVKATAVTEQWLTERVQALAQKAEDSGQLAVAKGCYELLGRDKGVFVERRIVTVRRLADLEMPELEELAGWKNGSDGRRSRTHAGSGGSGRAN